MRRMLAVFCFLSAMAWPAFAGAVRHLNTDELLSQADMVVLGEVVGVDQGVDSTRAQIRVLQALKGPQGPGTLVTVESRGGKVYVEESEPTFMTMQSDLLFLQKTDQPGIYNCVNHADGQKIVRGSNIYPYYDNLSYGVPTKDYLKHLEETLKAAQASAQEPAA